MVWWFGGLGVVVKVLTMESGGGGCGAHYPCPLQTAQRIMNSSGRRRRPKCVATSCSCHMMSHAQVSVTWKYPCGSAHPVSQLKTPTQDAHSLASTRWLDAHHSGHSRHSLACWRGSSDETTKTAHAQSFLWHAQGLTGLLASVVKLVRLVNVVRSVCKDPSSR